MNMLAFQDLAVLMSAVVSFGVGLAAMGVDILKILHLQSLRIFLQGIAGLAGAITLVYFFKAM